MTIVQMTGGNLHLIFNGLLNRCVMLFLQSSAGQCRQVPWSHHCR
jgi:hypothetical protein